MKHYGMMSTSELIRCLNVYDDATAGWHLLVRIDQGSREAKMHEREILDALSILEPGCLLNGRYPEPVF